MDKTFVDRRVSRTKKLLRDAVTELMREKGFDEITVSDITSKADINRGTFYLHYRDKFDLVDQNGNELLEGLEEIRKNNKMHHEDVERLIANEEEIPFLTRMFEHIQENADFMKVILGPKGDPSFRVKFKEIMKQSMTSNILSRLNENELIVPIDYISAYTISANLGVIQHWLETGMEKSPQEMSLIMSKLIFSNPTTLFGPVVKKK